MGYIGIQMERRNTCRYLLSFVILSVWNWTNIGQIFGEDRQVRIKTASFELCLFVGKSENSLLGSSEYENKVLSRIELIIISIYFWQGQPYINRLFDFSVSIFQIAAVYWRWTLGEHRLTSCIARDADTRTQNKRAWSHVRISYKRRKCKTPKSSALSSILFETSKL